MTDLNH